MHYRMASDVDQEMTDLADLVLDENEDHVAARSRISALIAPVVA